MQEAFITHTIEILVMLLVAFLLGLLLGYILWYKWRRLYNELQLEHERLNTQHIELEKEAASLRYKVGELEKSNNERRIRISSLEGDVSVLKSRLEKCEEGQGGDRNVMGAAGPPPQVDDLKKIEGIGPKIEKLCNAIGIWTWRQLADTSVDTLQKMLDDAGPRYQIANPGTWPKQAEFAANDDWAKLKEYQDFLDGGVDPK